MFGFKKKTPQTETPSQEQQKLKSGLSKTRSGLFSGLKTLFTSKNKVDPAMLDDIEDQLIVADVGIEATQELIGQLRKEIKKIPDQEALLARLHELMVELLQGVYGPLNDQTLFKQERTVKPALILVVGVNGAGKTTSIGKIASKLLARGHQVSLAAGDTFRAAAIEQLQAWGERNQVPVTAQSPGSDSSAVIFDGLESARARDMDVLIADTAGRLHTKHNLMEELKKIRRTVEKFDVGIEPEVLLVLDATTGQNALIQAKQFHQAADVTGIVLTKLDGSAKGGIVFALAKELSIPIRYIGVGESIEDLQEFEPEAFVDALLEDDQ